jgi:hypothetical protein
VTILHPRRRSYAADDTRAALCNSSPAWASVLSIDRIPFFPRTHPWGPGADLIPAG